LAHRDFDSIAGRSRLGLDQIFIRRRQYQKAAIRTCVFDRDFHQSLDQLGKDYLGRNCLRCLDGRPYVQLLDSRADRGRSSKSSALAKARMQLIKLPNFSIRSPTQIT
jgi:hypothetical protein